MAQHITHKHHNSPAHNIINMIHANLEVSLVEKMILLIIWNYKISNMKNTKLDVLSVSSLHISSVYFNWFLEIWIQLILLLRGTHQPTMKVFSGCWTASYSYIGKRAPFHCDAQKWYSFKIYWTETKIMWVAWRSISLMYSQQTRTRLKKGLYSA